MVVAAAKRGSDRLIAMVMGEVFDSLITIDITVRTYGTTTIMEKLCGSHVTAPYLVRYGT